MNANTVAAGVLLAACFSTSAVAAGHAFRVGAFAMDVTPTHLPVIINGGHLSRTADKVHSPLHVRWLVLDDGQTRLALGVLDTCVIPAEFADEVKARATKCTGIAPDRIMLSATHTHSAPSLMQCLGTPPDPHYPAFALPRIVEGLKRAVDNLAPARVGWTVAQAPRHTHTRVWIRRPDKMLTDPFGDVTVRANMHPGYQNPDAIGPVGPSDPALTILAAQSPDGRPIALLANYSMHYFAAIPVSASYFGLFAEKIGPLIGAGDGFVASMSQGTSGDQHWMDYSQPNRTVASDAYASELAQIAANAYKTIQFQDAVPLAMREKTLHIATRQPDAKRLAWARDMVDKMGDRLPRTIPEVYAREALWLKENPVRPVKIQALRVGELGIAIWPCEVFAISGLKIKARSPLRPTMNIELANAEEGYIPPPEIFPLGGYNTWPCRSASLAPSAEPTIVEALLGLLEDVSGRPRRKVEVAEGPYAKAILAARPVAYWRLEEWGGPTAYDATGAKRHATYEPGVARWLDGPPCGHHCPHFAGSRLTATLKELKDTYTIEMWFWNGLPNDARPVTGHLLARGGESLAIGGARGAPGRLVFGALTGRTDVAVKTWNHVVLVRHGPRVAVYLNGSAAPEISGDTAPDTSPNIVVGGRADKEATLEGKMDEVAIYDRALTAEEAAAHWKASGMEAVLAAEAAERARQSRLAIERAKPPRFSADSSRAVDLLKPAVHWPLAGAAAGTSAPRVEGSVSLASDAFAAFNGNRRGQTLVSATAIAPGTWNHVVFVRHGRRATPYLNGASAPAFDAQQLYRAAGYSTHAVEGDAR